MPRRAKGLSAAKVQKAGPGRYGDGAGLYLYVRSPAAKFWTFRYVRKGKMRELGLGPAIGRAAVSLVDARKRALVLYNLHKEGRDPLAEREAARAATQAEEAKGLTFEEAAARYIKAHRAGWRNAKHVQQWENTLATYCSPVFGSLAVQAVDTALVLKVLEPIWATKPETASRLRGRIEQVLDWAKARGHRSGDNPARWKGHLKNLLPARAKVRRVEHHAAMAYDELPTFTAMLRQKDGTVPRALEFAILTAARTGEVLGATWDEIDLNAAVWTVPPERMKGGKEHRVPLAPRALKIVKDMRTRTNGEFVFPGGNPGRPLSDKALAKTLRRLKVENATVHGFRSCFRDWCAERTSFPSEVAEMALAHAVGDEVERAYRRTDLFEKRHKLMTNWATFCAQPASVGKVVPMRRRRASR